MKVIRMKGLSPKVIEVDYRYLVQLEREYEAAGQHRQAGYLRSLRKNLEQAVGNGARMTGDLIETTVNNMIDENDRRIAELREQAKQIERENAFLRNYSERDNDSLIFAIGL